MFVADNLAYFPYVVQDEPLFVMHHIEITVSVSGANLLQTFKDVSIQLLETKWCLKLCMVWRIRATININSELAGTTMGKNSFEGVVGLKRVLPLRGSR